MPSRPVSRPAFEFVLDLLQEVAPRTRPFFGAHGVYVGPKIVLILREKGRDEDDGVWVATTAQHHASLRAELPSLRSIRLFGDKESSWQILPADGAAFESEVTRACELIAQGDPRIGKVPASKKPKSSRRPGRIRAKRT